jgi:hypothetical protein
MIECKSECLVAKKQKRVISRQKRVRLDLSDKDRANTMKHIKTERIDRSERD